MTDIPIKSLKRMRLKDNDIVVIRIPHAIPNEVIRHIEAHATRLSVLTGVRFHTLILTDGADVEIISTPTVYGGD